LSFARRKPTARASAKEATSFLRAGGATVFDTGFDIGIRHHDEYLAANDWQH
jgi:hypothetical protein